MFDEGNMQEKRAETLELGMDLGEDVPVGGKGSGEAS